MVFTTEGLPLFLPIRVPLFDLKQVESVIQLVKLKGSIRIDDCLDESEVGFKLFMFKSPAKIKFSYLFKALLNVTEISSKKLSYEKFLGQ